MQNKIMEAIKRCVDSLINAEGNYNVNYHNSIVTLIGVLMIG